MFTILLMLIYCLLTHNFSKRVYFNRTANAKLIVQALDVHVRTEKGLRHFKRMNAMMILFCCNDLYRGLSALKGILGYSRIGTFCIVFALLS